MTPSNLLTNIYCKDDVYAARSPPSRDITASRICPRRDDSDDSASEVIPDATRVAIGEWSWEGGTSITVDQVVLLIWLQCG
jgi:hypothetical protein